VTDADGGIAESNRRFSAALAGLVVVSLVLAAVFVVYVVPTLSPSSNQVTLTGFNVTYAFAGKVSKIDTSESFGGSWPIRGPTSSYELVGFEVNNNGAINCTLVGVSIFAPFSLDSISGPPPYHGVPAPANAQFGQGGLSTSLWVTFSLPSSPGSYELPVTIAAACG